MIYRRPMQHNFILHYTEKRHSETFQFQSVEESKCQGT